MTVEDLIKKLSRLPSDLRVIIPGYENGYNDITIVRETEIVPDYFKEWYYGQHLGKDDFIRFEELENPVVETSILLDGENLIAKEG